MELTRLIEILRCPETQQPVREATPEEIADCNRRIATSSAITKSGTGRSQKLVSGLIRDDGALLFPVENGIPVMLIEEALVLV